MVVFYTSISIRYIQMYIWKRNGSVMTCIVLPCPILPDPTFLLSVGFGFGDSGAQ